MTDFRWSLPLLVWSAVVAGTALLGWMDYATGHEFNFFVFYFVPICLVTWKLGLMEGIIVSTISAAVWYFADYETGHRYSSSLAAVWNTLIRLSAFLFVGWAMARLGSLLSRERELSERLKKSMAQIRVLEGIVPICGACKKMRNSEGRWEQMEAYIEDRTHAEFSHGLCPDCARKMLAEAGIENDRFRAD
jgi:K+-sensing histidine kinase KdpD